MYRLVGRGFIAPMIVAGNCEKVDIYWSLPAACVYNLDVDFRSRNSLSAGGQGASSACACGVSLDAHF